MIVGAQKASGERFVSTMGWDGYIHILEAFEDRPIRITYDRGALELLSPSATHEMVKKFLAQIIEFACFEEGIDYLGGGSTTFKRKILERGLEPDECYYFQIPPAEEPKGIAESEPPSPDLAIEIEISRSSLDRLGIYAALGVPEVWRYTVKHELIILTLGPDGYTEIERSNFLPFLPTDMTLHFLNRGLELLNGRLLLQELRDWLAQQRS